MLASMIYKPLCAPQVLLSDHTVLLHRPLRRIHARSGVQSQTTRFFSSSCSARRCRSVLDTDSDACPHRSFGPVAAQASIDGDPDVQFVPATRQQPSTLFEELEGVTDRIDTVRDAKSFERALFHLMLANIVFMCTTVFNVYQHGCDVCTSTRVPHSAASGLAAVSRAS